MVRAKVDGFRRVLVALPALLFTAIAMAVSESDVAMLDRECEAARQEALAPIRAQRTQACIDQQLRSPSSCETYYKTYGNVGRGPSGAPVGGYFFDLPPCQKWLKAREDLRLSHSR